MPKKQKQSHEDSECPCMEEIKKKQKKAKQRRANKMSKSISTLKPRQPQSISVILQGSTMSLPPPPTQDYNMMVQQLDAMRRQQAMAGSLIPNIARNDLLNRVQATNPFSVASTNTISAMTDPYESLAENQVEGSTTINSYNGNSDDAKIPIDQDFIRNARIERFGQNLGRFTDKIGVVEDVETISDLSAYDDEDLEDRLTASVENEKSNALAEKVKMMSEDEYIRQIERQVLDKNYERFLKKKREEEKYLTRRINLPEPDLEEPTFISTTDKGENKQKALRATSQFMETKEKFEAKTKPKGRPKK